MSSDPENDGLNYEDIEEIPDINDNVNGSENKDISKRLINAGQIEEETVHAKIEELNQKGNGSCDDNEIKENIEKDNNVEENIPQIEIKEEDMNKITTFNKQNTISMISKIRTSSLNSNTMFHNPPMTKLEKAENKYYMIKNEIEEKFFNHNNSIDEMDYEQEQKAIAKKNKEMISYLEKLSNVLSMIIENTKILNKQNEMKKNKRVQQQMTQEQLFQEAEQLNLNNQKFIEVYRKQYTNLQARLNQVSQGDYLQHLENESKELDEKINKMEIEKKKLQNEQKLNEIVINKISKGDNKGNFELKRIAMDYESLKRQQVNLVTKLEQKKQIKSDNEIKLNQLSEFEERLKNIAKEMYNLTTFENVKNEEKNEKKMEEQKKSLTHKIAILEKVKYTNRKKYEIENQKNERTIIELQQSKDELLEKIKKADPELINQEMLIVMNEDHNF